MKSRRFIAWILIMALLTVFPSFAAAEQTEALLVMPTSLQTIEDEAFMGAANLNEAIIAEGTKSIGIRAFANSSLRKITLPASLESISDDAFEGCTALTVVAEAGSYAYEWAVRMGYINAGAFIGPMISGSGWNESMISADIVVYMRSNQGIADDIWWWDFCREYFKIDFDVTQTTSASDFKSIAFMGGVMPDVFYQMYMSSNQQTEMGDNNGFLLNLEPYMTSSVMPNLTRIFNAYPNAKKTLQTSTGAIYGMGAFNNPNDANVKFYINQRWLNEAGLSMPTTLDEFETVLAAFKSRGDGVVPMAGDYGNCPRFLANAMGWTTNSASYLTSPALRMGSDGKRHAEFIFGNREVFPEFLKKMNKWYTAGYFSPNMFSSQTAGDESNALKAQDKTGFEQSYYNAIDTSEWVAARFLTSQWNSTPQVGRTYNAINNQSFSLASDVGSSKARRLMKWLDWHYDYDNYQVSHYGPGAADTAWLFDLKSGFSRENGQWTCAEVKDGTYNSFGTYQNQRVQGIIGGYVGLGYDMFNDAKWPVSGRSSFSHQEDKNVIPYIVDPFPQITFMTVDDIETTSSLSASINTYVNEQFVMFVIGEKEINSANLSAYFAQLDKLGFQEYQNIYYNYYENNFN